MGSAGKKKIHNEFSLKTWGPKVSQMMHSVVKDSVNN
jgi:hypothetical protein